MLEVLTGNQVNFQPISPTDAKLVGEIVLKNSNSNLYMPFKVKSTDKNAFEVDPSKGIVIPHQTTTIKIYTVSPVDMQYAKVLSQKNKFLIQYGVQKNRPVSIEEAVSKLNSVQSQNIKICINTDSVRGSRRSKPFNEVSVRQSNKYSFHSVVDKKNSPFFSIPPLSMVVPTKSGIDEMDRLKSQIEYLEKQRMRLSKDMKNKSKGKGKSGNLIKYTIVLLLGMVIGNIASKYTGAKQAIAHEISKHDFFHGWRWGWKPEPKPEEEGFFSIFNFGDDDDGERGRDGGEKRWWNPF